VLGALVALGAVIAGSGGGPSEAGSEDGVRVCKTAREQVTVRRQGRARVSFTARKPVTATATGSATEPLDDGSGEITVTTTATRSTTLVARTVVAAGATASANATGSGRACGGR